MAELSFYSLLKLLFSNIENFRMIFLSIVIEALPFILVGVFISALINNFASEDIIQKFLPKHKIAGIFVASFFGVFFPLCECGIVPITGRLLKKGLPLPTAMAFMLAVPVINPVVAFATAAAFNGNWAVAAIRLSLALVITLLISLVLGGAFSVITATKKDIWDKGESDKQVQNCSMCRRLTNTLTDSCNEFFDMGKYLLMGALLSTFVQTFIPYSSIAVIGQDPITSVFAMLGFAFGLSVCSTSDAFIAASFVNTFTLGAVFSFMVLGPMLDVKNVAMFFHVFSLRFILTLAGLAIFFSGMTGIIINYLFVGGVI